MLQCSMHFVQDLQRLNVMLLEKKLYGVKQMDLAKNMQWYNEKKKKSMNE